MAQFIEKEAEVSGSDTESDAESQGPDEYNMNEPGICSDHESSSISGISVSTRTSQHSATSNRLKRRRVLRHVDSDFEERYERLDEESAARRKKRRLANCDACRRGRKSCDKQQPSCNRCVKSGIWCVYSAPAPASVPALVSIASSRSRSSVVVSINRAELERHTSHKEEEEEDAPEVGECEPQVFFPDAGPMPAGDQEVLNMYTEQESRRKDAKEKERKLRRAFTVQPSPVLYQRGPEWFDSVIESFIALCRPDNFLLMTRTVLGMTDPRYDGKDFLELIMSCNPSEASARCWERIGTGDQICQALAARDLLTEERRERLVKVMGCFYYLEHAIRGFQNFKSMCAGNYDFYTGIDRFNANPLIDPEEDTSISLVKYVLAELVKIQARRGGEKHELVMVRHHHMYWTRKCTVAEFMEDVCRKDINYEQWKWWSRSRGTAHEILCGSYYVEFPDLDVDRNLFTFRNGTYHNERDEFYHVDHPENMPLAVSGHASHVFIDYPFRAEYMDKTVYRPDIDFFSNDYDPDLFPTPMYDRIMETQRWPGAVRKVRWAMNGRLLFELHKHDNFQCWVLNQGRGGTGKSTTLQVMAKLFDSSKVFFGQNRCEPIFGMQLLPGKHVWMLTDIKGDFNWDTQLLLNMISGEQVTVSVKNKDTVTMDPFLAPGEGSCNAFPEWLDDQGQWGRRTIVFPYERAIPNEFVDPLLFRKIHTELPMIVLKSSFYYLQMARQHRHHDIKLIIDAIPMFRHARNRFARSNNAILSFLTEASSPVVIATKDDAINNDVYLPLNSLLQTFEEWRQHRFPGHKYRWSDSAAAAVFEQLGVERRDGELKYPRHSGNARPKKDTYIFGVDLKTYCEVAGEF